MFKKKDEPKVSNKEAVIRNVLGDLKTRDSHHVNFRARIAVAIIERWAMVACQEDGEDSSGRQKLKLLDTKTLVTRAMEIADETVNQIESRNWLIEIEDERKKN